MEFFEDNHVELYNLLEDLGERNDLAKKTPGKARELQTRLAAWRTALKAPMPTPNKPSAEPSSKQKKEKKKNKEA